MHTMTKDDVQCFASMPAKDISFWADALLDILSKRVFESAIVRKFLFSKHAITPSEIYTVIRVHGKIISTVKSSNFVRGH